MLVGQVHGQKDIAAHAISAALRDLVTCNAISGELELYVRMTSLSSVTDTEIYVWNADYGVVHHQNEDPTGTAP